MVSVCPYNEMDIKMKMEYGKEPPHRIYITRLYNNSPDWKSKHSWDNNIKMDVAYSNRIVTELSG
jgi:hypothetical protein